MKIFFLKIHISEIVSEEETDERFGWRRKQREDNEEEECE